MAHMGVVYRTQWTRHFNKLRLRDAVRHHFEMKALEARRDEQQAAALQLHADEAQRLQRLAVAQAKAETEARMRQWHAEQEVQLTAMFERAKAVIVSQQQLSLDHMHVDNLEKIQVRTDSVAREGGGMLPPVPPHTTYGWPLLTVE